MSGAEKTGNLLLINHIRSSSYIERKSQEPRSKTEYTVDECFANYYVRLIYSLYIIIDINRLSMRTVSNEKADWLNGNQTDLL
jgi:hypothetical protein